MVAREIRISKQANVNMAESTAATYATETNAAPDASKTIGMLMTLCDCQTMFNITNFTDALEITRQAVSCAFKILVLKCHLLFACSRTNWPCLWCMVYRMPTFSTK